jgi:hypothetical protein
VKDDRFFKSAFTALFFNILVFSVLSAYFCSNCLLCKVCLNLLHSALFCFFYSFATEILWPRALSKAVCLTLFKSCSTISAHISSTVISGIQPSFSLALVGSPSRVSFFCGSEVSWVNFN